MCRKRGIGDATVKRSTTCARARGVPLIGPPRDLVETDELEAEAAHGAARPDRRVRPLARPARRTSRHTELAEIVLDESGYTEMWQERPAPPKPPGRLENLKELVRSMDEFDSHDGFLEHVALVMDTEARATPRTRSTS